MYVSYYDECKVTYNTNAMVLLIFPGAGSLACRLFHGWLADHKSINKFMLYSIMCFLSGCGMIAYKFSDQYYQMIIASVAYVIGSGITC